MQKPGYIKELDGLRGIAILLVLVWHYLIGQTTEDMLPAHLWQGLSWTWSGVDLFFVLSGFLIGRILLYYKSSPRYFKTFYIRRTLRIFPPYYLLLVLYVISVGIGLASQFPVLLNNYIPQYSYFLYIQNFYMAAKGFGANALAVTWSLAIEEQFYLLFPLLLYFLPQKHLPKVFLGGILLAPLCRAVVGGYGAYVLLPARMDGLLVGALIAYFFQTGQLQRWLQPHTRFLGLATLLVFAILIANMYVGQGRLTGGLVSHSLYTLFYGLLLVNILLSNNRGLKAFFGNPVLRFTGNISYSIYLYHMPVLLVLTKLLQHRDIPWLDTTESIQVTLLSVAVTFIVATLSFYLLERPLQRLGKKAEY